MTGILEQIKIDLVWAKARKSLTDPSVGYDAYGNVIHRDQYGNRNSAYGWEMDHYPTPKAFGGTDHVDNLRPLHHSANSRHGAILKALMERLGAPTQSTGLAAPSRKK